MLNLSMFSHNHHPSRVKMVAKFIRRGIRVIVESTRFEVEIALSGAEIER